MIHRLIASIHKQSFLYSIGLICIAYAVYEFIFIPQTMLSADEFVFLRHIYEYTFRLPYLHFAPYKSTLGHYLFTIPLFFSHDAIKGLFYIKNEIVILNLILISLSCYWASSVYNKKAIVLSLLAVLANQLFLVYSTELRVDLLASWACLLATLTVLQHRMALAGILLGIGLLISQKAIWYVAALNVGMVTCWLCFSNSIFKKEDIIKFNWHLFLTVFFYLVFWSCIAGSRSVLTNFFYDAYIQVGIHFYQVAYGMLWANILAHGPFLFFFWPMAALCLLFKSANQILLQRQIFVTTVASVAILSFIHYKQPFPYNFVFTVPAFFILYTEFFTWLTDKTTAFTISLNAYFVAALALFFATLIVLLTYNLKLTPFAYTASLFPMILGFYLFKPQHLTNNLLLAVFALTAIVIPFANSFQATKEFSYGYQLANLRLINELLKEGGTYLAGVPYIYTSEQPIIGMKNMIGPQLNYLHQPSEGLRPLLLSSLYLAPTTTSKALADLQQHPVRFYVNNHRMVALPTSIRQYLTENYTHYYGSIYIFAPKVASGIQPIPLKAPGIFRIVGEKGAFMNIDGLILKTGSAVKLSAGKHISSSQSSYRLVPIPNIPSFLLDPRYEKDDWNAMLKVLAH